MAYDATKTRVSGRGGDMGRALGGESLLSGGSERTEIFNRFATTISGQHITTITPFTKSAAASGGYYITVLDLSPYDPFATS
jgi:hypothetical protein